jgi:structural maintenance of chromosome 3 (chondroitin sulfate proteoglycan 6)
MENTRKDSGDRQDKLRQQLERAQENSKSASRELRDLKHRAQAAREERDTLNAEQQQLLKEKSKLELTIKVSICFAYKVLNIPTNYNELILGSE